MVHGREDHRVSTITIELPEDVVASSPTPAEFARELRLAAAIHWYSRGLISQGRGAEIAGMDRRSFILALGQAGVDAIQVSPEELKAEVESELEARRQRLANHLPPSCGASGPVE
jgi:predicted HTH domain antitoxin